MTVLGEEQIVQLREELTGTLDRLLARGRDAAVFGRAQAECAAAAEALCAGPAVACRAGCPHCCVLNVAILLPEGLLAANWLREHLGVGEVARLRERLAAHCRRIRWMDDEERIFKRTTCPFLDAAGCCIIHPVRPLMCRAVASWDSDSCRAAFAPLPDEEGRLVPADRLRQAAYDAAFVTLAGNLQRHGLDDRSIELGAGVLGFLDNPGLRCEFLDGNRLPRTL